MLRTLLPLLVACGLAAPRATAQDHPRLANMYWIASVDSAAIAALARWDIVVLNPVWTNAQLARLRALNPDIRIYFYVIAYTVELPSASITPWKLRNHDYAAANDLWWYDRNQNVASDWPNTSMVNITDFGPAGPQGTWRQFFAASVESLLVQHPDVDGIFLDNFWKQLSWQQPLRQIDSDCNPTHNPAGCDGVADSNAYLDSLWNSALRSLAADLRARLTRLQNGRPRPLAILTNNATDYLEHLNGTMIEYFPSGHSNVDYGNPYGYNWNEEMFGCPGGYLVAPFNADPYKVLILNGDYYGSVWQPARNLEFERHKRFTLVSALLGDGYYSLDAGESTGHGNLWWEPEYDHAGRGKGYLGAPLGPAVRRLQPTGPEILANPSFDSGASGWSASGYGATGSLTIDTGTFRSAPASARVDVQSVAAGGHFKVWQSPVPLAHTQAYTLSFWARSTVDQELVVHFYSESCPSFRCWNDRRFCLGSDWQRYEIAFHSSGTAAAGLNLFVGVPGTVWIDDVSLRTGDTSLFRRDFERGVVLLNYTNTAQNVDLGGTFWRLKIPYSPVFDGARVTSELLPPSDARIVLRDSVIDPPDSSTVSDAGPLPGARRWLHPNIPNPFNPTTQIRFEIDRDEHVHLGVYDLAGRLVRELENRRLRGGIQHRVAWDGRDAAGRLAASSVYLYRLRTPTFQASRKMVLVR